MEPVLVRPGEGEPVREGPERTVLILAGLDRLAVTWSRYAAGVLGASPHVHREHADGFWVLAGELTFTLGERERQLPAGSFALAPPGVVHGFRNRGPAEARFLNVHAPSGRFHEAMRARRDGRPEDDDFDTYDPPEDGGLPVSEAVLRGPGEGEELNMGGSSVTIKAGRHDAGGRLALTELTLAPGFPGPVPHRHREMIDSFWVLEGSLRLHLGDEELDAPAGTYALAPPGTVHTFSNPGEAPVRALNLMVPGGLEQYLKEVAAALAPGAAPDPQLMAGIAARYDFVPES